MADVFELYCPRCKRFLAEVTDYARIPCPHCGTEVTVKSKGRRDLTKERAVQPPRQNAMLPQYNNNERQQATG